jgi:hypothetical protein
LLIQLLINELKIILTFFEIKTKETSNKRK